MDEEITVAVPLRLEGEAKAVLADGGLVDPAVDTIEVVTTPRNMPDEFVIDITDMQHGHRHPPAATCRCPRASPPPAIPRCPVVTVLTMRAEVAEIEAADAEVAEEQAEEARGRRGCRGRGRRPASPRAATAAE